MLKRIEIEKLKEKYDWDKLEEDIEAASSVGSMILLISAILVSSILASVMVNTISKYQQQAEKTSDEAIKDVSTGVSTISISGDRKEDSDPVNPNSNKIQVLELIVKLEPGSGAVDLDDMMIQIDDGNKKGDLTLNSTGVNAEHADSTNFIAVPLRDPEGLMSPDNIMSKGTLVKILISLDPSALDLDLDPNTPVNLKIIPLQGHPTPISFTTPSVYSSRRLNIK